MRAFEDFVGDAKQRDWAIAFSIVQGFFRLRNSNYLRTSSNFWNPEVAQAGREKFAQPGLDGGSSMEYRFGAYLVRTRTWPDFSFWRAVANSAGENFLVKKESSGVGIFQRSEFSSLTNLVVSRSLFMNFPFLISWEAMAFAEIGHWRGGCP